VTKERFLHQSVTGDKTALSLSVEGDDQHSNGAHHAAELNGVGEARGRVALLMATRVMAACRGSQTSGAANHSGECGRIADTATGTTCAPYAVTIQLSTFGWSGATDRPPVSTPCGYVRFAVGTDWPSVTSTFPPKRSGRASLRGLFVHRVTMIRHELYSRLDKPFGRNKLQSRSRQIMRRDACDFIHVLVFDGQRIVFLSKIEFGDIPL
jgi:hypothetical protein